MAYLRMVCCSACVTAMLLCDVSALVGRADPVAQVVSRAAPEVAQPPANAISRVFAAISQCRGALSESERWRIAGAIHQESQRYGYDPLFVVALAAVESTCLPTARSRNGAVGLIQVRPSVARAVAEEAGIYWRGARMLTKPLFNVHLGLRYLAQLEQRFDDPYLAVAAYNLGPTRVARMSPQRARGAEYVRKVLSRYDALVAQHGPGGSRADS